MVAESIRVTGGPAPWDYVVGACTVAATVIGLIAIVLALRGRTELIEDRRHTFELRVLLELLDLIENQPYPHHSVQVRTRAGLLPAREVPALLEWLGDSRNRDDEAVSVLRRNAVDELHVAIGKRTR
jgi:hypothetical protein